MVCKRCQQCALFQMDLQSVSVLAFVTIIVQNLQQLFEAVSRCNLMMMLACFILISVNCIIPSSLHILGFHLKYVYWDSAF